MVKHKRLIWMTILLVFIAVSIAMCYYLFGTRDINFTYKGVIVNTETWDLEDHASISFKGKQKRNLLGSSKNTTFEGTVTIATKKQSDHSGTYKDCVNYLADIDVGYPKDIKSGGLDQIQYNTTVGDVNIVHIGSLRSSDFFYKEIALTFLKEKPAGSFNETTHVLIAPAGSVKEAKELFEKNFKRNKSTTK